LYSLTVCLQWPLAFKSLISRSDSEERMYLPPEKMVQERTCLVLSSSEKHLI
jgi:hypothetical protein